MKGYLILVAFLFCLLFNVQAQSVSGIVSNSAERMSGVVVKNISSSNQATTDDRGMFTIRVRKGDTLLTSNFFYKTDTTVYTGQAYLVIQLQPPNKTLREVTINSTPLTPLDVYEENKKEYKDIYWKGDYSKMFGVSIGTMPGVALNVDKLYNLLSKQGKDARKMQHTLLRDYHDDVIDHHFTITLVRRVTGYDSTRLDTFMIKYRPTYDFIVKASEYDVIQYIKDKLAIDAKKEE